MKVHCIMSSTVRGPLVFGFDYNVVKIVYQFLQYIYPNERVYLSSPYLDLDSFSNLHKYSFMAFSADDWMPALFIRHSFIRLISKKLSKL